MITREDIERDEGLAQEFFSTWEVCLKLSRGRKRSPVLENSFKELYLLRIFVMESIINSLRGYIVNLSGGNLRERRAVLKRIMEINKRVHNIRRILLRRKTKGD